MKKTMLFFLFACLAASVFSRDIGTLSVTVVSSEYGTGLTKVRYDSSVLSEICATYDVEVKVRFFDDEDFQPIPGEDIDGGLTDVAPGIHTLTWDGSASFSDTYSEEAVIRVLATTSRYDLVVAADPASGGTAIDQTDEGPYEKEVEISIQAVENTGYNFTGWQASSGSFADQDAPETTFTMPDVNATVTATFELIDYTLTLTANPQEGGTVEDVTGNAPYNIGDEIQIKAEANEGWEFVNWTGDTGGLEDVSNAETTLTMPASNVELTAIFQFICGSNVTFTYRNEEVTYGTIERGGLCWMNRNLGAERVPKASDDVRGYGDLFQWGRLDDGHQDRESGTAEGPVDTDVPGHGNFLTTPHDYQDWRDPSNPELWQGEEGINNPCPSGWRLPVLSELSAERDSWGDDQNVVGAYNSTLKWPAAGIRIFFSGDLYHVGTKGRVASSSSGGERRAMILGFNGGSATMHYKYRAYGVSVRCVRDLLPPKDD